MAPEKWPRILTLLQKRKIMGNPILIIGSNCFSGSHFVDFCLRNSDAQVTGISRSPEYHEAYLPYKWDSRSIERFKFHQLDLNKDLGAITDLVAELQPGYIVNFAAQGMVAQSWDNPEHWLQTNTLGHIRLHERLRKFDFIRKYVHVSTPEVYGNTQAEITEESPMNPSTPYAVSKAACDMSLKTFHARYGFPVVFTRAANVYGPAQQLYRIIPRTIIGVHIKRKLQLDGGGHSVRAFIHIRDVCEATFQVMQEAEPPNTYHLTTRKFHSIREIVETTLDEMGVSFLDHVEVAEERPGKDMAYTLNPVKAEKEFNWRADTSLREGIRETVNWVQTHLDHLKSEPLTYIHKL
jgi:dTDP-glucose 4,6-dehydratase